MTKKELKAKHRRELKDRRWIVRTCQYKIKIGGGCEEILENGDRCNSTDYLTSHHLIYREHLWLATDDELKGLCDKHHKSAHGIVAKKREKKAKSPRVFVAIDKQLRKQINQWQIKLEQVQMEVQAETALLHSKQADVDEYTARLEGFANDEWRPLVYETDELAQAQVMTFILARALNKMTAQRNVYANHLYSAKCQLAAAGRVFDPRGPLERFLLGLASWPDPEEKYYSSSPEERKEMLTVLGIRIPRKN